ncbi:MAG: glycerol uptake facilitator-like aquaporin [Gammaproteobacteria bacterium]|jgi:glycerol uptake facilitator-like aquaporin
MKKQLIGALVGGLILFMWQFASWGPGNIHASMMQHTPNQDALIADISKHLTEDGTYFVPRAPLDASEEEMNAQMANQTGKPWAMVSYHKSYEATFGINLIRGFIIDVLAVFFLCWVLMRMRDLDMKTALITSLMIGAIGYLTISYLDTIWFKNNSIPYLIDTVVSWGLIGAWLGWWLPRD